MLERWRPAGVSWIRSALSCANGQALQMWRPDLRAGVSSTAWFTDPKIYICPRINTPAQFRPESPAHVRQHRHMNIEPQPDAGRTIVFRRPPSSSRTWAGKNEKGFFPNEPSFPDSEKKVNLSELTQQVIPNKAAHWDMRLPAASFASRPCERYIIASQPVEPHRRKSVVRRFLGSLRQNA
jgi:hypothetical protein